VAADPETLGPETANPRVDESVTQPRRLATRVRVDSRGPTYVEGPVEIRVDDGEPVLIDRFTVAICACRRSRRYPLCDNSHLQDRA
jgi:hypothetical protein